MGLLSLKLESIPTVPLRAAASATAALHSHDTSVSEDFAWREQRNQVSVAVGSEHYLLS